MPVAIVALQRQVSKAVGRERVLVQELDLQTGVN